MAKQNTKIKKKTKGAAKATLQEGKAKDAIDSENKKSPPEDTGEIAEDKNPTSEGGVYYFPKIEDLNAESEFNLGHQYVGFPSTEELMKEKLVGMCRKELHDDHNVLSQFIERLNFEQENHPSLLVTVEGKLEVLDFTTILNSDLIEVRGRKWRKSKGVEQDKFSEFAAVSSSATETLKVSKIKLSSIVQEPTEFFPNEDVRGPTLDDIRNVIKLEKLKKKPDENDGDDEDDDDDEDGDGDEEKDEDNEDEESEDEDNENEDEDVETNLTDYAISFRGKTLEETLRPYANVRFLDHITAGELIGVQSFTPMRFVCAVLKFFDDVKEAYEGKGEMTEEKQRQLEALEKRLESPLAFALGVAYGFVPDAKFKELNQEEEAEYVEKLKKRFAAAEAKFRKNIRAMEPESVAEGKPAEQLKSALKNKTKPKFDFDESKRKEQISYVHNYNDDVKGSHEKEACVDETRMKFEKDGEGYNNDGADLLEQHMEEIGKMERNLSSEINEWDNDESKTDGTIEDAKSSNEKEACVDKTRMKFAENDEGYNNDGLDLLEHHTEEKVKMERTVSGETKFECDDDERKTEFATKTYRDDSYSFLALYGPIRNPLFFGFGFSVFLFQVSFQILMILRVVHPEWSKNGDVDNPSENGIGNFIPADVPYLARGAQVLALLAYCFFAYSFITDLVVAVEIFPNFKRATQKDKLGCMVLSCTLRFTQALLGIASAVLLVVTNVDVIDIILNFTAVNFISNFDEVAFKLASGVSMDHS